MTTELTSREWDVIHLISRGHNRESIGNQLGISANTAGRHKASIFRKMHVNSVLELVLCLYDLKLKQKLPQNF